MILFGDLLKIILYIYVPHIAKDIYVQSNKKHA